MKPANPFAVVKECKGAALSLLVLLATNRDLGGGAVTQEWLERHSGYTDKTVSQALAYLGETGRVRCTSAGWVLAENAQAPGSLPGAAPTVGAQDPEGQGPACPSSEADQEVAPAPLEEPASRNISDSPTTTSAKDLDINTDLAEEEGGVGIIPTPANLEHVEANLAVFRKWGVGRNEKTIVLASRAEVTPQQIESIARRLVVERRFTTGLLITAVQSDDQPVPNLPNKYAPQQVVRDPSRYAEWEE